jgi:hypothetical protein
MGTVTTTLRREPYAIALLRGGPRAAVTVAVLTLHLRGAVEAGRSGRVRRTSGASADPGRPTHHLEKAVWASLRRRTGLRKLLAKRRVRKSLTELRAELVAAGLLHAPPRGRSPEGRRTLDDLRTQLPLPVRDLGTEVVLDAGCSTDDRLFAAALYGGEVLVAVAPEFVRDAGLVGHESQVRDDGLLPHSWGGWSGWSHGDGGFGSGGGGGGSD